MTTAIPDCHGWRRGVKIGVSILRAVLVSAEGAILSERIRRLLANGEGGRNTNIFDLLAPLAHPEHLVQDGFPLKVSP
jgi:hypothetical protein